MSLFCTREDILNESDVEQKFIMPLLTSEPPRGFGFEIRQINTKKTIKSHPIDKGTKSTLHIPDYLISVFGLPLVIIEAKTPGSDLSKAFNEAQLYAQVINKKFKHDINPCSIVIATDGLHLLAGHYDSNDNILKMELEDFCVGNKTYEELLSRLERVRLERYANACFLQIKSDSHFIKPVSQIGGKRVQDTEIRQNSFGVNLAFDYQNIFTPDTEEDKFKIVENAYVVSRRREHQAEPIYKLVKRDILLSQEIPILNAEEPKPLIDVVAKQLKSKKSLILLVGSKGSGKSTFIRHIYKAKLGEDIQRATIWMYLDMNNVNYDAPYDWVATNIYYKLQSNFKDINFSDIDTIKKVFAEEINEFDIGLGSLFVKGTEKYNEKLHDKLSELLSDKTYKLKKYTQYFLTKHNKTAVIVFDNCDKLETLDQLKMFEMSQWLRNEFPYLLVMPLRDTTYDNYHNSPPLDTVIKDLVFRIDPPDFLRVLQERLKYIMYLVKQENKNIGDSYTLPNSISVSIKENEYILYFKSILNSIRNDAFTKDIFYGLTCRNIRRGIEIFLNFCKSGHIPETDFLKIRVSEGEYTVPHYMMVNALMRGNRRYYSSESSPVKNIFSSKYSDVPPDPFIRLDILRYLEYIRKNIPIPSKFTVVGELLDNLICYGHSREVLLRELKYLIDNDLVLHESKNKAIEVDGLVGISICGSQHIHLQGNINYLATCAEDTYFKDSDIASRISERIRYQNFDNKNITFNNANDLIQYLMKYKDEVFSGFLEITSQEDNAFIPMNLEPSKNLLHKFDQRYDDVINVEEYPSGTLVEFRITYIQDYGIFGIFDNSLPGFISKFNTEDDILEACQEGDRLIGEIVEYSHKHNRFQLSFVSLA